MPDGVSFVPSLQIDNSNALVSAVRDARTPLACSAAFLSMVPRLRAFVDYMSGYGNVLLALDVLERKVQYGCNLRVGRGAG